MKIHKYLNLPEFQAIPNTTNDVLAFGHTKKFLDEKIPKKSFNVFGVEMPNVLYNRFHSDTKYVDYVTSLMPELENNIVEVAFQTISNVNLDHPVGAAMMPHTDGKRGKYCIHWVQSTGGDDCTTYWFQEKDHPVIRPPWTVPWTFDNLSTIDSICWKPNTWGIFRADILHSIYPLKNDRTTFCISFNDENLFYLIMEKYGLSN